MRHFQHRYGKSYWHTEMGHDGSFWFLWGFSYKSLRTRPPSLPQTPRFLFLIRDKELGWLLSVSEPPKLIFSFHGDPGAGVPLPLLPQASLLAASSFPTRTLCFPTHRSSQRAALQRWGKVALPPFQNQKGLLSQRQEPPSPWDCQLLGHTGHFTVTDSSD